MLESNRVCVSQRNEPETVSLVGNTSTVAEKLTCSESAKDVETLKKYTKIMSGRRRDNLFI